MTSAKDVTGNVSHLVGSVAERLPDIDPDEVLDRIKGRAGWAPRRRRPRLTVPLAVVAAAFGAFMVVRVVRSKRTTTTAESPRPSEVFSHT